MSEMDRNQAQYISLQDLSLVLYSELDPQKFFFGNF